MCPQIAQAKDIAFTFKILIRNLEIIHKHKT